MPNEIIEAVSRTVSPPPAPTTSEGVQKGSFGNKDDFLRLLVAQMQQQDPLNPQDPTEFTSQLTQFSNLEQLINVNKNLTGMQSQQDAVTKVSALGLIGKQAEVSGDLLRVESGQVAPMRFTMPEASTKTSISIYNDVGNLVRVINLGPTAAGNQQYQWNGLLESGGAAIDGAYSFEIIGETSDGRGVEGEPRFTGRVDGVRFDEGGVALEIGGGRWRLEDILGILEPAAAAGNGDGSGETTNGGNTNGGGGNSQTQRPPGDDDRGLIRSIRDNILGI